MLKLGIFTAVVMMATAALAATPYAVAHEDDELTISGAAIEKCLDPGDPWAVLWTITNDEGANPFGIIDADTSDGQDVLFVPLLVDVGDGYIPASDDAHATTTHANGVASTTLEVEHDVTDGDNTFFEATVTRPANCVVDDASITVRKDVTGSSNDATNFNIDVSPGSDITNIDETDAPVRRGDLTPGLFVLTEYAIPAGYEFVSWVCESDQIGADIDEDKGRFEVAIELRTAEDVFCVATNRPKLATPTATATAVPPTATPTLATATPVPSATAAPATVPNITNVTVNNLPPAPVAPTLAPAQQASQPATVAGTIKPPAAGSGDLLGK